MDATQLGELVRAGVTALRAGDAKAALVHFTSVVGNEQFQTQADMRDLYARVLALMGQCHLALEQPAQAQKYVHKALRVLRELEDSDGMKEVQQLNNQVLTALMKLRQAKKVRDDLLSVAARPIGELLAKTSSNVERAGVFVEKANAMLEAGEAEQALKFAEQGLNEAQQGGAPREIVLAWLTIARTDPSQSKHAILAAWECANRENEFNLVSMIAATASSVGVDLPSLHGPGGRVE